MDVPLVRCLVECSGLLKAVKKADWWEVELDLHLVASKVVQMAAQLVLAMAHLLVAQTVESSVAYSVV